MAHFLCKVRETSFFHNTVHAFILSGGHSSFGPKIISATTCWFFWALQQIRRHDPSCSLNEESFHPTLSLTCVNTQISTAWMHREQRLSLAAWRGSCSQQSSAECVGFMLTPVPTSLPVRSCPNIEASLKWQQGIAESVILPSHLTALPVSCCFFLTWGCGWWGHSFLMKRQLLVPKTTCPTFLACKAEKQS